MIISSMVYRLVQRLNLISEFDGNGLETVGKLAGPSDRRGSNDRKV
jgi:hypothetical protein